MKKYTDSTLFRMTKSELVDWIRCLEHSIEVEQERNERQFQMLMEYEIKKQSGTLIELPRKPSEVTYAPDKGGVLNIKITVYCGPYDKEEAPEP